MRPHSTVRGEILIQAMARFKPVQCAQMLSRLERRHQLSVLWQQGGRPQDHYHGKHLINQSARRSNSTIPYSTR